MTVQADQFQLPDGTVLDPTQIVNVTIKIEKVNIENATFIQGGKPKKPHPGKDKDDD